MAEEKQTPQDVEKPKTGSKAHPAPEAGGAEDEHYEIVSEYRIGEGPPPLFLVVAFACIVAWALFSWIPFFGY